MTYKFKKSEFETEKEAIEAWLSAEDRRYYTIFHVGSSGTLKGMKTIEFTEEKLREEFRAWNSRVVYYKGSSYKGYMYKSFDRINLKDLDYIDFRNTKGMYGNICGWARVYKINDKFVLIQ